MNNPFDEKPTEQSEENLFASPEASHRYDPYANLLPEERERIQLAPVEGRFVVIGILKILIGVATSIIVGISLFEVRNIEPAQIIFFFFGIGYVASGVLLFNLNNIGRALSLFLAFLLLSGLLLASEGDPISLIFLIPTFLVDVSLFTPGANQICTYKHKELIQQTPGIRANIKEAIAILILVLLFPAAILVLLIGICIAVVIAAN